MSAPNFIVSQPDRSAFTLYDAQELVLGGGGPTSYVGPVLTSLGFSYAKASIRLAESTTTHDDQMNFIQGFSMAIPTPYVDTIDHGFQTLVPTHTAITNAYRTFVIPIIGQTFQVVINRLAADAVGTCAVSLYILLIP
jgi:hypothetical protein